MVRMGAERDCVSNKLGGTYVGLGTNLAHAGIAGPALLRAAVRRLRAEGFTLVRCSSIWETAPWPPTDQGVFCNAVVELDRAGLGPQSLFDQFCVIERAFGRIRRERWGPRTLDLDVLDVEGMVGVFGAISLPHKRLHERAFVLAPLAELDWRHPVLGASAAELLGALAPGQQVTRVAGDLAPR